MRIEVEIEPWEVLDEMSDKELLEEVKARKLALANKPDAKFVLEVVRQFLLERRPMDALSTIEATLYGKSPESIKKQYEQACERRDSLGRPMI